MQRILVLGLLFLMVRDPFFLIARVRIRLRFIKYDPNKQESVDLITFAEEILEAKLNFCAV